MAASDYNQDLPPGLSTGLGRTPPQSFPPAQVGPFDTWSGVLIAALILVAIAYLYLAKVRR